MAIILTDQLADATPSVSRFVKRLVEAPRPSVDTMSLLLSRGLSNAEHRSIERAVGHSLHKTSKAHPIAREHGWFRSWRFQRMDFDKAARLYAALSAIKPSLRSKVNRIDIAVDFITANDGDAQRINAMLSRHACVRVYRSTHRLLRHWATNYHARRSAHVNFVHYADSRAAYKLDGFGCHSEVRIIGAGDCTRLGLADLANITKSRCLDVCSRVVWWCEHADPDAFNRAIERPIAKRIRKRVERQEARYDRQLTQGEREIIEHGVRMNMAKALYNYEPDDAMIVDTNWARWPIQNALAAFPRLVRRNMRKSPLGRTTGIVSEIAHTHLPRPDALNRRHSPTIVPVTTLSGNTRVPLEPGVQLVALNTPGSSIPRLLPVRPRASHSSSA